MTTYKFKVTDKKELCNGEPQVFVGEVDIKHSLNVEDFMLGLRKVIIGCSNDEVGYDLFEGIDSILRHMESGGNIIINLTEQNMTIEVSVTDDYLE